MPGTETKAIFFELPRELARDVKTDAARRGVTLRQLYTELTTNYLRERREEPTGAE